jgi:beta-barrel assembly-enhancing protease
MLDRAFVAASTVGPALLSACVGATTQLAPLPPGAIEAEQEKERALAIEDNERQQARLDSLAYPILAQSTSLCPTGQGALLGLRLATIHNFEREWQPAAVRMLGISDTLTVTGVVPYAPAASAGLLAGDRLLSLGRVPIPSGPKATNAFAKAFSDLQKQNESGAAEVIFERSGVQRKAVLSLTPVCAYGTVVVNTGELNAFADGKRIYVTSTMMRFASDEELRVVIAHEFAHNAMEHLKAKEQNSLFGGLLGAIADVFMATQGVNTGGYYTSQSAKLGAQAFSQDFEREADYVGLYAMAVSGAPLDAAPRFWRHMAQADPKSIQLAHTHPTTAERFVRMEYSIREIENKRARQLALVPERKSGAKDRKVDESAGALMAASAHPVTAPAATQAGIAEVPTPPAAVPKSVASAIAGSMGVETPTPPMPTEDTSQLTAEPADTSGPGFRSNSELLRNVELRHALEDVTRLRIVEDYREVSVGLLSVMLGPGYGESSTEYNLNRLLAAYRATTQWDPTAAILLWQGHRKLGMYTSTGLRPFPEQGFE